ncbi:hypothetical protein [Dictyobacter kobayashii]|uniref:Uncharacterized protein n=1 Tax=Dictyobacter kobayashii TaxID=2014872 RepID=A0A402ACZ0_9CHLR|nr:hypothetical protein [Dictyobacter kobayashii]GCE16955.1 hypothetical protein KDK_07550 [Dictyobacter kobayashii]
MNPYQNNSQFNQQYANAWDQGTYNQIPHQEAWQNYNQFAQNVPPQVFEQAHQQVYEQMPPEQRGGLLQNILGGLTQRGVSPQQMGVQNTDPYTMSPADAARVTSYAQQQQPDVLHQVFSPGGALGSPWAKLAVAGVAAFAAKQFLGGGFGGGNQGGFGGNQGGFGGGNQNNDNGLL